jgi:hypothetical protein
MTSKSRTRRDAMGRGRGRGKGRGREYSTDCDRVVLRAVLHLHIQTHLQYMFRLIYMFRPIYSTSTCPDSCAIAPMRCTARTLPTCAAHVQAWHLALPCRLWLTPSLEIGKESESVGLKMAQGVRGSGSIRSRSIRNVSPTPRSSYSTVLVHCTVFGLRPLAAMYNSLVALDRGSGSRSVMSMYTRCTSNLAPCGSSRHPIYLNPFRGPPTPCQLSTSYFSPGNPVIVRDRFADFSALMPSFGRALIRQLFTPVPSCIRCRLHSFPFPCTNTRCDRTHNYHYLCIL